MAFTHGLIEKCLEENPVYFENHAFLIKDLMDRCLKQGNVAAFSFLLYLNDGVHQHIKMACDQGKNERLENIRDKWPNRSDYLDKATELFENEEIPFNDRVDMASYLISMWAKDVNAWDLKNPSGLLSPEKAKIAANLLKIGSFLEIAKGAANIPVIADDGLAWMKQHLIPAIDELNVKQRNRLLNGWIGSTQSTDWVKVKDKPFVYRQGQMVIDLKTMQILEAAGKENKGLEVAIPKELSSHPRFQIAFGDVFKNEKTQIQAGKTPGQFIYTFKNNRLVLDKNTGSLIIEKEQEPGKWFRFCIPENGEKGLETLLSQRGIWVSLDNPKSGWALPSHLK